MFSVNKNNPTLELNQSDGQNYIITQINSPMGPGDKMIDPEDLEGSSNIVDHS